MGSGEDHHRSLVGVVIGNHLIHVEEVSVAVADNVGSQTVDGILEVQINGVAGSYTVAGVAAFLGCTRGDVAGAEVTEGGIAAFQIEVAVLVGDVGRSLFAGADSFGVFFFLRNPDAAVVTERFAHEGQLRLVFAVDGNTGRVDLGEGEVRQVGALLECLDGGGAVAAHGVGREEERASVAAGCENHGVGGVAFQFAGHEVAHDDTAATAVNDDDVEHFAAVERAYLTFFNLAVERRVGAEQQLLAGLAFGIERTGNLSAAKRTVGEKAAVFAGERNALLNALVDDVVRHFGQTIDVGFARAEVTALDCVIEQAINRVAVVLIVLGCVYTALCGD